MDSERQCVFIAYAHSDWKWLEMTSTHLRVLQSALEIEVWSDTEICGGDDWINEIEKAISRASLAILLISAKFLTSEFICRKEVPKLLKRSSKKGLPVIPLLIRDCAWNQVPWLSDLQMRPSGAKPLANHTPAKAESQLAIITNEVAGLLRTVPTKAGSKKVKVASKGGIVQRARALPVGGLKLPCFFPSVAPYQDYRGR